MFSKCTTFCVVARYFVRHLVIYILTTLLSAILFVRSFRSIYSLFVVSVHCILLISSTWHICPIYLFGFVTAYFNSYFP